MYRVLEYFTDLKDNCYSYSEGDTYPRDGYTPTEERIEELSTDKNVRKRPIIEPIVKAASKTVKVEETIVSPAEVEEEKPKRRGKKKD